ncbi:MAG: hypothetical protein UX02_C0004G0058 [Candidatus Moranbacteria bacterium GW2011_GWC1_45_18]|nr:MAG: hypothetical protein UT79_C0003G0031 [Candidatus Moranbacteria bacterium GW2011_GWC2_40_12]KKT33996.1 MAG: hypothetical protein UW19_C0003G0031 [Candidatus Moranbacteria bacterium GW2011_GWF2_44_10]KKT99338.1 MAG: hypothetical protein UX02_C0004G0058 [Candidatus Moranbacteria bacterium GW2011_GWC1_45_18]OGI23319.1 MAG: hypothetical protein A2194_03735 [Candidatus Moranbacteria bacterium RIFOXYA1_FULL_44_8]OGI34691.1 MAG: hypothetical protein A2407_03580 [Candidatus Moranbacteria bacteri
MLETAKNEEHIPKINAPTERLNPNVLKDFFASVPVGEDLFQGKEKRDEALRASSFLGIVKSLDAILEHFDELSKEERQSVLDRTDSVLLEAHRWSHISSNRDIQRELQDKIAQARIKERNRPILRIVRKKYHA